MKLQISVLKKEKKNNKKYFSENTRFPMTNLMQDLGPSR